MHLKVVYVFIIGSIYLMSCDMNQIFLLIFKSYLQTVKNVINIIFP